MSYTTITRAARDVELQDRIAAAVNKEVHSNPAFGDTQYGGQVKLGFASYQTFYYPTAVANEAAYESAVVAGNPSPGGDPAVITDADILAVVQEVWPEDPVAP